ncbi:CPBP family intramembrane glutamic endopeptidase [Geojedonia litorea]|uniref:CPBP family intramembrane glutamic endopeptidase n=1 Tax=Geojedonia litorea TaxID=1268269 RepID=A0ABV9N2P5_9FLAO
MMSSKFYKSIEFFLIFIVTPVSFTLNYPIWIKLCIGLLGFGYVIYVLLKVEHNKFKIATNLDWKQFFKHTILKLLVIMVVTTLYMWLMDSDNLFIVFLNKPLMWLVLLFIYSLLSVYPQELIYRTFFFQRYQKLVSNDKLFIFINAILFSLGHLFFRNALVVVLTFIGGLLFAATFNKTRSTLLVSIEHAIYGCWLFTVGMGSMLGFPN